MPWNDDSWYACLVEQGHLWVDWLHPLDLCKTLLLSFLLFFRDTHLSGNRMPVILPFQIKRHHFLISILMYIYQVLDQGMAHKVPF